MDINIIGNIILGMTFWVGIGVTFGGIRQILWDTIFQKESYVTLSIKGLFILIEQNASAFPHPESR